MQAWAVQEAKARFSEFLETCLKEGPQMVTKRGLGTAVLIPLESWNRIQAMAKPSFKDLLLSDEARFDLDIPERMAIPMREIPTFD